MTRLGLIDGTTVRIKSRGGEVTATLAIDDAVMPGVASLPHGYGHGSTASTQRVAAERPGSNANALTDELFVEPIIATSILNGVPITVERA